MQQALHSAEILRQDAESLHDYAASFQFAVGHSQWLSIYEICKNNLLSACMHVSITCQCCRCSFAPLAGWRHTAQKPQYQRAGQKSIYSLHFDPAIGRKAYSCRSKQSWPAIIASGTCTPFAALAALWVGRSFGRHWCFG